MKKFLNTLVLFMVIGGLILAIGGFSDAKLVMKGKTINLNEVEQPDMEDPAIIEGQLDFVYGPFATYEEKQTRYGVTVSEKETDFFIVGNFNNETYQKFWNEDEDFVDFYVILSTADEEMRKKLTAASDEWVDFLNSLNTDAPMPLPEIEIDFSGKLASQSEDDDYLQFRQDAFDDLGGIGIKESQYAGLRIVEGEIGNTALLVFFGGIALFIIGIVIFILMLVANKKRKKANLEFINSSYNE